MATSIHSLRGTRALAWLACAPLIAACSSGQGKQVTQGADAGSAQAGHAAAGKAGGASGESGASSSTAGASGAGPANAGAGGKASTAGNSANAGTGGAASAGTGGGGAGGGGASGASAGGSGGHASSSSAKLPVEPSCSVPSSTPPATSWTNVTGNLAGMASECGNLTLIAADPCGKRVIAGVAKAGLWATTDAGASWVKLGSGAGSATIVHRPSSIVFDPEHPEVFYESGIYGSFNDGVYKTTDGGSTFQQLGTIGHIDLVSVDFHDPNRKTLLAGAHETKQKLFLSTDGGSSWTDIGPNLPAGSHFSSAPLVLDPQHFLLGACGWGDGTCGVFASDDGGQSWKSNSSENPVTPPLWMADGHLVWSTIYDTGAILSDDLGQSWTKVNGPHSGLPVELPDRRIVAVGSDHLIASNDDGKTWSNLGEALPYKPAGVTYSAPTQTFYIWRNDCGTSVLADAVMSAGLGH